MCLQILFSDLSPALVSLLTSAVILAQILKCGGQEKRVVLLKCGQLFCLCVKCCTKVWKCGCVADCMHPL